MMTPQQQFQVYKDAYKKAVPTTNNKPKQQAATQQPKATTPAPKK
jgi:hypothetical protein